MADDELAALIQWIWDVETSSRIDVAKYSTSTLLKAYAETLDDPTIADSHAEIVTELRRRHDANTRN